MAIGEVRITCVTKAFPTDHSLVASACDPIDYPRGDTLAALRFSR